MPTARRLRLVREQHATTTNHPRPAFARGPPRRAVIHASSDLVLCPSTFAPDRTPDMLFTTFLLSTAACATAVQGALLLRRKPDAMHGRILLAHLAVAATVAALVGLGLGMA